ncbi:MAG: FAD-dependent oxidoreductase, partial [Nocardiopsaceae bacterium]|nr:FAD-dependent oxidoreductase [Nocardiopsaceae bacterium]
MLGPVDAQRGAHGDRRTRIPAVIPGRRRGLSSRHGTHHSHHQRAAARLPLRVVGQLAEWDVAVIGGGPAGLAAARAAAAAGARTVVLERAVHPRYKTCGGGLMGAALAAAGLDRVPSRDSITAATFTLRGGRGYTRRHAEPLLAMVLRDEFDDALRRRAEAAGATVRQQAAVRGIEDDAGGHSIIRLAD